MGTSFHQKLLKSQLLTEWLVTSWLLHELPRYGLTWVRVGQGTSWLETNTIHEVGRIRFGTKTFWAPAYIMHRKMIWVRNCYTRSFGRLFVSPNFQFTPGVNEGKKKRFWWRYCHFKSVYIFRRIKMILWNMVGHLSLVDAQ